MELYKINDSLVINKYERCLNIIKENDYNFFITGDNKESKKLIGNSFKITEYDRKIYKVFSDFFTSLEDTYNAFKDFHDYTYEEYPLYDKKHNCFTFYDDNSNINDSNIFRIIKNDKKEPYTIGIYIENKSNRLQTHTFAKSGSKYPQFLECIEFLIRDLKKLEQEKTYVKKKEE